MVTIEKKLNLQMTYPLEHFCDLDKILFFDIETTGFSGDYSCLYLIGCTFFRDGDWHLIQWFADRADAEEELLHGFFHFLSSYSVLIHFNGDGFDIPYLLKRCRAYHLSYDFSGVRSIDIYRLIKPYKKLLNLDSLKQKRIEAFLTINREDMYSGGQLIEVYNDYLMTGSNHLYDLLILHNEDDLKGMPSILPILYYPDFLNGEFIYQRHYITDRIDIFGKAERELSVVYEAACTLPVPVQTENSVFNLELSNNRLTLTTPLIDGELKHYYSDYQNYYYLIYEDNAIHKSVGQYVDKDAKKKATRETCYTRTSGTFFPQPAACVPLLKTSYKDKIAYAAYMPELFSDAETASQYITEVIKNFFLK